MPLSDKLFKEVYVVGADHIVSSSGPLKAFENLEDLLGFLAKKNVSTNSDLRVLHGYLTPAAVIPRELGNCNPYILIEDPYSLGNGLIFEADAEDFEELAEEVEEALQSQEVSAFFAEMENAYLFYGYELNVVLSVNEEDLDDDRMKIFEFVSTIAKDIYERRDPDE